MKLDLLLGGLLVGFGFFLALATNDLYTPEPVVVVNEYGVVYEEAQTYFGQDSSGRANGFYSEKGYFCVATKGRSSDEIARTTFHELSHYFVHQDKEHFLGVEE